MLPLVLQTLLCALFLAAWAWQLRTRNAGGVDVFWAASLGATGLVYALLEGGWAPRRLLVATLAGAWSVRLTAHLAARVFGEAEDGRYAALRREWGERFDARVFWLYQSQALLVGLLGLGFATLCRAPLAGWRVWDFLGLALFAVALGGEALADRQLSAWRADPSHRGRTCREGLWGVSRHPNYFFEWLHWLIYPLLGIGLPGGWLLWLMPALMLLLIVKVTGIPPTEIQSLRSRGEDYRAYQRTTNAFFPGPRRADPAVVEPTP